jgi:hypothetical protein
MNTHKLATLYDQLTPRERLPLLIAAGVRGDLAERERLISSAPKKRLRVPDYFDLAQALAKALDWHVQTVLELATSFWYWWGLWTGCHGSDLEDVEGPWDVVRYHASRLVAQVDGWQRFCSEIHMDSVTGPQPMPSWETIERTERVARKWIFTPEEAASFVRQEGAGKCGDDKSEAGPVPVKTVEMVAKEWHEILDELTQGLSRDKPLPSG